MFTDRASPLPCHYSVADSVVALWMSFRILIAIFLFQTRDQVALPTPGSSPQQCVSQQELDSLLDSYLGKDGKLREVLSSHVGMVCY